MSVFLLELLDFIARRLQILIQNCAIYMYFLEVDLGVWNLRTIWNDKVQTGR